MQLAFWTGFADDVVSGYGFPRRKPAAKNWYYLPIGTSLAKIVLTIDMRDGRLGCKLAVEPSRNADVIRAHLARNRSEIEAELGFGDLDWGVPTATRIYRYGRAALDDPRDWPGAYAWLGRSAKRFRSVFEPWIERIALPANEAGGRTAPTRPSERRARRKVVSERDEAPKPTPMATGSRMDTASVPPGTTVDALIHDLAREHRLRVRPDVRAGDQTIGLYSEERKPLYRYAFVQWWRSQLVQELAAWVLLNPAPGDTDGRPRPVLEYCLDRTRRWGYSGLVIVNLFAYRTRDPDELKRETAIGPENDVVIRALTAACGLTVAAWGDGEKSWRRARAAAVVRMLRDPQCLEVKGQVLTRFGQPLHPLFKPRSAPRVPLPRDAVTRS